MFTFQLFHTFICLVGLWGLSQREAGEWVGVTSESSDCCCVSLRLRLALETPLIRSSSSCVREGEGEERAGEEPNPSSPAGSSPSLLKGKEGEEKYLYNIQTCNSNTRTLDLIIQNAHAPYSDNSNTHTLILQIPIPWWFTFNLISLHFWVFVSHQHLL